MISTNQFTSSGSYLGAEQYVLQDFAGTNGHLYKGGASTVTTLRWSNAYSSVEEVSAPGAGGTYALSYTGNGIAVTFNPTTGTAHSYSVSLGAIDAGTATGYKAPQPNSAWSLDAGDGRITDATYANGKLYAVFEVNTGTSGSPAPTVHWVELDTTKLGTSGALVAAPTGDIPTQNMSLADLLGSVNPMDLLNILTGDLFDVKSLGSSTASAAADLPFSAGSLWPTPSDHGLTGGLILHA